MAEQPDPRQRREFSHAAFGAAALLAARSERSPRRGLTGLKIAGFREPFIDTHPQALRALLVESFRQAIAAADPNVIVPAHVAGISPRWRAITVVGAGKAAGSMARALEAALPDHPMRGLVVTRYGHAVPTQWIQVIEAGHPVPDALGVDAARAMVQLAQTTAADELLVALISGGGSSLMTLPADGLTLEDLKQVNRALLTSGAPVELMNVVRKHLSGASGGRLAAAATGDVLALIISDVTGDQPSDIASGPCAPDPSTYAEALAILGRYAVPVPAAVQSHLERGRSGALTETPKPGDALFERVENRVIATPHQSLDAAAAALRMHGIEAVILGDTVTGEAREAAKVYAALVREIRRHARPWPTPVALISGGECTVTLRPENIGSGRGGRCSEFLLALAIELADIEGVYAVAGDTDGIDGSEDNAGAIVMADSLARARSLGLDAQAFLDANDAWGFFDALGDLVVTGPTLTNVNDYRVILVV